LRGLLVCALLAALLLGCEKNYEPDKTFNDQIEVQGERMTLHHGPVGLGEFEKVASYVLVDAKNISDRDLDVTLGGHLTNGKGDTVGMVDKQSLRIPAGEVRTFALVDENQRKHEDAGGARVEVSSALRVKFPQAVKIEEVHVYPDPHPTGDRVVVAGYAHNTAKVEAAAVVIASFYDREGKPMKRPSSTFRLASGGRRGVQFVGPPGSTRAALYVGQVVH
jgi:hypothetical protein